MHIAFISRHASLIGGAEHYMRQTAEHLRERSIRSTLLYDPTTETSFDLLEAFDAAYPLAGTQTQLATLKPDVIYAHQLSRTTAEILTESSCPVVEFLHDHHLFCLRDHKYTLIGQRPCRQKATITACYPCGGFLRRADDGTGIRIRTIHNLNAEQRAHKQFHAFITGSHYMATQAAMHGFDENRIRVLPLFAVPPPNPVRGVHNENRLLYVGGVFRGKGLDVLFEALSKLGFPAHLDIIGDGSWMSEARSSCEKLGIADRVAFLGRKDHSELAAYYQNALCLIMPSRTPETFGLVGVEAMSHGTAVIASDIGGIREWLVPERTGLLVPPNDPVALRHAITRLLERPKLARNMGDAGRARYLERFLPEHHIEKLISVFTEVMHSGSAQ